VVRPAAGGEPPEAAIGKGRHIQYRHPIDWLVRKPGGFAGHLYREELFPSSQFRMAYDALKAAQETESGVEDALRVLLAQEQLATAEAVEALVRSGRSLAPTTQVVVEPVDLTGHDELLECREVTA